MTLRPRHARRAPLGALALLAAITALAAPATPARAQEPAPSEPTAPGADAFSIRYYLTNEDGETGRLMTTYDFQRFTNLARCECGQRFEARVRILNTTGNTTYKNVPMKSFVGPICDTTENVVNSTFRRCAVVASGQTSDFQYGGKTVKFSPLWLYRGVDETGQNSTRAIEEAIPAGNCTGGQGSSGVWVCAATDATPECQASEFIITGTQQNNVMQDAMTTMPISGIAYDYVAPTVELSSPLSAAVGDGAVELSWGLKQVNTDVSGFRVLCERADDQSPGTKGLSDRPPVIPTQTQLNGTIYYTKENVCPNGPFWSPPGWSDTGTDTTTTTGGTTDTSTTADTSTTDTSTTDTSTTDTSTTADTSTTDTGTTGDTTTGDTTTGDTTTVDACAGERPAKGVCSLKWDYVCSAHVAGNAKSVRVSGLTNDVEYNFLLIAYDKAGNPVAIDRVEGIAPKATNDFWDQCEADGGVCGQAGFCRADAAAPLGAAGALGLALATLGVVRRRKRTPAC